MTVFFATPNILSAMSKKNLSTLLVLRFDITNSARSVFSRIVLSADRHAIAIFGFLSTLMMRRKKIIFNDREKTTNFYLQFLIWQFCERIQKVNPNFC